MSTVTIGGSGVVVYIIGCCCFSNYLCYYATSQCNNYYNQCVNLHYLNVHARTHARTHTRTHAHTHTRMYWRYPWIVILFYNSYNTHLWWMCYSPLYGNSSTWTSESTVFTRAVSAVCDDFVAMTTGTVSIVMLFASTRCATVVVCWWMRRCSMFSLTDLTMTTVSDWQTQWHIALQSVTHKTGMWYIALHSLWLNALACDILHYTDCDTIHSHVIHRTTQSVTQYTAMWYIALHSLWLNALACDILHYTYDTNNQCTAKIV